MNPDIELSLPPQLRQAIQAWGAGSKDIEPIAADGSDRRFYRLRRPGGSLSASITPIHRADPVTENDSYFFIGQHLRRQGAPVPEIYTYCPEEGWFLLEDLGDRCVQEEYYRLQR